MKIQRDSLLASSQTLQPLTKRAQSMLFRMLEKHGNLLHENNPENMVEEFDKSPPYLPYHHLPDRLKKRWYSLLQRKGENDFGIMARCLLLHLISDFEGRAKRHRYTNNIVHRFKISLTRIIEAISNPQFTLYNNINDILLKDLAICRQSMFPAGAQVVEAQSSFPRSLLIRGGLRQMMRFARLLLTIKGNKPVYQIHTHLMELEEFNPRGWEKCYLFIAEMLQINTEVKGMYGGSWFYDPALEKISPRLVYLRKQPEDAGAYLFYSNVSVNSGALSKSETRRRLYQEGRYIPRSYTLIWPREQLIDWAAKQNNKQGGLV